jgi:ABC-type Fe3+/spermidine/putrescine transport system ATPase subunit
VLEVRVRRKLPVIDLDIAFVADAGVTVLFGPSGAGKSLTLRIIAGIEALDSGLIKVGERTLLDTEAGIHLLPQQRHVGYVPQQYALFPHLTALENVTFPLRKGFGWTKQRAVARATDLLESFGLAEHLHARPGRLSGGQQQRVALARALAIEPEVLLLDEPFSALDTPTRLELRDELRRLHQHARIPIVFVTHDLEEAATLGDRMAVVIDGRVRQYDRVRRLLDAPADWDVANLVQARNLLSGRVRSVDGCHFVELSCGRIPLAVPPQHVNESVFAVIRPESIALDWHPARLTDPSDSGSITGTVIDLVDHGRWVSVIVQAGGDRIEVSQSQHDIVRLGLASGVPVSLRIPNESVHLISR